MNRISAVVLTKNEEEMLPACLASLDWVDEIVVADSFSTDRTREIALAAGAKFVQHPFENFSTQFNWGIEQAAGPWILMIDADEVVDAALRDSIKAVLAGNPGHEVYMVLRDAFFLGRRMKSSAWSNEALPRLFRKGSLVYSGLVHPIIDYGDRRPGKVGGRLLHYSYRTMAQYFDKMRLYSDLWAKDAYASGKRIGLSRVFISTGWRFFHNYFIRGEIIDGEYGFLTATLYTMYTFMKYAKLWGLGVSGKK